MALHGYCILLFNVLIFSDFTAAYEKPKFGCTFDDNYNLLDKIPNDGSISQEPIWTTGEIRKASFKDAAEFKEFIKALNIVNDKVQSSNLFNTLDNVIAFWEDYSKEGVNKGYDDSRKMYFNKFFQSYKARVTPNDGAFFAIKFANQFMEEYPKFADKMQSVYLSSCNINNAAIEKLYALFKRNQLDEDPSKLPLGYFHDHVMSFMEFQIGDDGKNSGTIVMDCGLSMNDIIVLMDGEEDIHGLSHARTLGSGRIIDGAEHFYDRVGAYIRVTSLRSYRNKHVALQMCYVKKGICSFEEHTRKPWLTSIDHSLMAHDYKGDVKGGIFVNLYDYNDPKNTSYVDSGIFFWQRPLGEKTDLVHLDIPFKNLVKFYDEVKQTYKMGEIYKVARLVNIPYENMLNYISKIGNMIEDEIFIEQLKKLHFWFREGPRTSVNNLDYSDTSDVPENLRKCISMELLQYQTGKRHAFARFFGIPSNPVLRYHKPQLNTPMNFTNFLSEFYHQ